jgi:ribosomal protein S28E/S33
VNDQYTSVVTIDGGQPITPSSITDAQIVVDIPALSSGTHQLQLVKGGDTLSALQTLVVVPAVTLSSATLDGTTLTIAGTGFGTKPPTSPEQYIVVGSVGYATSITSWSDTQVVATVSGPVVAGDVVTVITADAGEAQATVTIATPTPTVTPTPTPTPDSVTVTSPNGGESWKRGTSNAITWNRAGASQAANVKIELLKGTSVNRVIASSTPNDGTQSWAIPSNQAIGTDYKIRITSVGHNPSYTDSSNANFQISR